MPTTSNFGWTTPADTDLVKDGAAAIRTLGNGIDTSLVDLKGGTTGQVLSKNSNTDLDYTWVTPNVGDITEVQAGTGISVASGTGPIPVVTNTVATAFDAKGDLVVGTGADTFAKLTVGTNGHTLVADSATSTGLKWAAPSSGALTKISTTSFSAVASQDIDNVFSSSYNNYLVVINYIFTTTAGNDLFLRFKYGATVQASGYYMGNWRVDSSGNSSSFATSGGTQFGISQNTGATGSRGGGHFFVRTQGGSSSILMINGQFYSSNSGESYVFGGDTQFSQTWTGMRFLAETGSNITGEITVFGLEK